MRERGPGFLCFWVHFSTEWLAPFFIWRFFQSFTHVIFLLRNNASFLCMSGKAIFFLDGGEVSDLWFYQATATTNPDLSAHFFLRFRK
jgi:hypothetical protein